MVNVGQGAGTGLYAIDYNNGRSYWSGDQGGDVTGSFAIKDFNTFLTNRTEDEILFQSQYTNRNKISNVVPTGLEPDTKTYPVVYIKNDGSTNDPFAFGGQDSTVIDIRAIVIADSQFEIDAIGSLFRDQARKYFSLFEASEMPFDQFGYYRNGTQYNYNTVTFPSGQTHNKYDFGADYDDSFGNTKEGDPHFVYHNSWGAINSPLYNTPSNPVMMSQFSADGETNSYVDNYTIISVFPFLGSNEISKCSNLVDPPEFLSKSFK